MSEGKRKRSHSATLRSIKAAEIPVDLPLYAPYATALARVSNAYCGNCGGYRINSELKYGAKGLIFCRYCGKRVRVHPSHCRQKKRDEKRNV